MFNLRKQIRLLYTTGILGNLSITGAWVVIMASRGFSLVQIGFAETVFHITSLLMEIPSGMLADVYGRKRMLALGNVMAITGDVITALSGNFAVACMAMPFHAMAYNFASGSGEALAYDSMKLEGKEDYYEKYSSNQSIIYRVASGISTLLAGVALWLGYRKAYLISAVTGLLTLYFTLKLVEIRIEETDNAGEYGIENDGTENDSEEDNGTENNGTENIGEEDNSTENKSVENNSDKASVGTAVKKLIDYFVESIRFLIKNPKATKLMFLNSFVGAIDILLLFFLQSKLRTAGISNWFLGVALLTMELGGVVGSKLIVRFKRVRYIYLFIICTVGVLTGVMLEHTGSVIPMVLGGFISSLCDDAIQIRTDAKLNDMFPSEQRATLVSISSFTFSVIMIVLSPLAGFFFTF
ncbi:MAG: MFS transporter, partial [Eubacterium sp.]|nr:MFS transporter [Eubacterium sp.]